MIRDIPHFDLGLVTDGAGVPSYDTAIAYSDNAGLERELELKGDGAIDLMPIIVQAVNSYDEMTMALRTIRESRGWFHLTDREQELLLIGLAKAEGREALAKAAKTEPPPA